MIVVFGCDQRFLPHLSVAIKLLLDNNSHIQITIYVIHSDINTEDWQKITNLDLHDKHTFINLKISSDELNDLVIKGQFTKATYYRLLIESLVIHDKVIYIDADVVVNGSLNELWNIDITDTYLAAVEEPLFQGHNLGMTKDAKYFNAGVMLINLKKWRDELISSQVIQFIRTQPDRLVWLDQCALNAIINGRWVRVSPKFNLQTSIFEMDKKLRDSRYNFGDIDETINHPAIIHYTGYSKPWHILNDHPYKNKYWHYLRMTPYKTILPTDISLKKSIVWCLPKKLRNIIKKQYSK